MALKRKHLLSCIFNIRFIQMKYINNKENINIAQRLQRAYGRR